MATAGGGSSTSGASGLKNCFSTIARDMGEGDRTPRRTKYSSSRGEGASERFGPRNEGLALLVHVHILCFRIVKILSQTCDTTTVVASYAESTIVVFQPQLRTSLEIPILCCSSTVAIKLQQIWKYIP